MCRTNVMLILALALLLCNCSWGTNEHDSDLDPRIREVAIRVGQGNGLQQALSEIKKLVAQNPNADKHFLADAYSLMAVIYDRLGDKKKSQETFQFVIKNYAYTCAAKRVASELKAHEAQKKITAECKNKILSASKPSRVTGDVLNRMQFFYNNSKYDDCEKMFDAYFSKFGMTTESIPIIELMIDCCYASRKYTKGIKLSSQLFTRFPETQKVPHNLIVRGNLLNELGNYTEAKRWYLQAIQLKKSNAEVYMGLGLLSQREGKYQEAHSYYEKARELAKQQHDDWLLRNAELYLKDVAPALKNSGDSTEGVQKGGGVLVIAVVVVAVLVVSYRLWSIAKTG